MFRDVNQRIRELPVLWEDRLIGCVCLQMENAEPWLNTQLIRTRWGLERQRIDEFLQACNASIFHYDLSDKTSIQKLRANPRYVQPSDREMYRGHINALKSMTMLQKKNFFGEFYRDDYEETILTELSELKWERINGFARFKDYTGRIFNFVDGHRVTVGQPEHAQRKILVYGPCLVVGSFVEDSATICSYLQSYLLQNGYDNYKVVNCGFCGLDWGLECLFQERFAKDDIIIILDHNKYIYDRGSRKYHQADRFYNYRYMGVMSEEYESWENPFDYFLDIPLHCNHIMNRKIARQAFLDIESILTNKNAPRVEGGIFQKYIIPSKMKYELWRYFREHRLVREKEKVAGAIVMNCNPFTKGHRYLIENACEEVDVLYVFVVEEDESYFSFTDRLEMVRLGTADMYKVRVIPSGQYILSKETFSQYFTKESVEIVEDMDYDIYIFCEGVANYLGIRYRYVGEEPFDRVTRKYNETMKRMLPEFNIELIEIPRMADDKGEPISATKVRRLLQSDEEDALKALLPESTLAYLKDKWTSNRTSKV